MSGADDETMLKLQCSLTLKTVWNVWKRGWKNGHTGLKTLWVANINNNGQMGTLKDKKTKAIKNNGGLKDTRH